MGCSASSFYAASLFACSSAAAFLLKLPIRGYYASRPTGRQQVTDRLFCDLTCSLCFCVVPLCGAVLAREVLLVVADVALANWVAVTVVAYVVFSRYLACFMLTSTSFVRFVNAFWHSRLSEISDRAVVWGARAAAVVAAGAAVVLSDVLGEQSSHRALYIYLTTRKGRLYREHDASEADDDDEDDDDDDDDVMDPVGLFVLVCACVTLSAHCAVESRRLASSCAHVSPAAAVAPVRTVSAGVEQRATKIAWEEKSLEFAAVGEFPARWPSWEAMTRAARSMLASAGGLCLFLLALLPPSSGSENASSPLGALAVGVVVHGVFVPGAVILSHPGIRSHALKRIRAVVTNTAI